MMAIARGGAAEQDRLGQCPVNGDGIAWDVAALIDSARHQTSAPPPNEKNDRKKLDAAKAIERPKHDLDQPAEAAGGIAEGQRQAGNDDDDHRHDFRHGTFDRLQDLLERLFPRHRRTGSVSGAAITADRVAMETVKTEMMARAPQALDHRLSPSGAGTNKLELPSPSVVAGAMR